METGDAKDNFANCIYYIDTGKNTAFRYDTELVGGKFCMPSSEALEKIV